MYECNLMLDHSFLAWEKKANHCSRWFKLKRDLKRDGRTHGILVKICLDFDNISQRYDRDLTSVTQKKSVFEAIAMAPHRRELLRSLTERIRTSMQDMAELLEVVFAHSLTMEQMIEQGNIPKKWITGWGKYYSLYTPYDIKIAQEYLNQRSFWLRCATTKTHTRTIRHRPAELSYGIRKWYNQLFRWVCLSGVGAQGAVPGGILR